MTRAGVEEHRHQLANAFLQQQKKTTHQRCVLDVAGGTTVGVKVENIWCKVRGVR